jgi:hypothetical protein
MIQLNWSVSYFACVLPNSGSNGAPAMNSAIALPSFGATL